MHLTCLSLTVSHELTSTADPFKRVVRCEPSPSTDTLCVTCSLTYSHMTALNDALDRRFDDMAEIMDVAKYGCAAGVSDFIYSTELSEFFNEHETDIEDVLDHMDVKLHDLVSDPEYYSFQELKEKAVWFVVENYCAERVLEHETLTLA